MIVYAEGLQAGDFFDARTGAKTHVPLPPAVAQGGPGLWLRDDIFFIYTRWSEQNGYESRVLQNGWLIDVSNQV